MASTIGPDTGLEQVPAPSFEVFDGRVDAPRADGPTEVTRRRPALTAGCVSVRASRDDRLRSHSDVRIVHPEWPEDLVPDVLVEVLSRRLFDNLRSQREGGVVVVELRPRRVLEGRLALNGP